MTFGRFMRLGLALAVVMGLIRFIFYYILADGPHWQLYMEWFLIVLAAIATSRRLGVINLLEAVMASGIWLMMCIIFDFLITSQFLTLSMFRDTHIWLGYLIMALAIFIFHKKRHIHIRHQLHGHH